MEVILWWSTDIVVLASVVGLGVTLAEPVCLDLGGVGTEEFDINLIQVIRL